MIPKKIHYCWLSGEKIPKHLMKCINSWREKMPEYELILWDTKRFDITSNRFVFEACREKKWAFAADYIRLYALYMEGGIYLDSDVIVKRRFDDFLKNSFFSAVEFFDYITARKKGNKLLNDNGSVKKPFSVIPGIGIQAAIMGSEKGHPFLKDCLEQYENRRFVLSNGELNLRILAPANYSMYAEKYGFRYVDEEQNLENGMLILPSVTFAGSPNQARNESYAIHTCHGSWRVLNKSSLTQIAKKNISNFFSVDTKNWLKRFKNNLRGYSRDSEMVFGDIYRNKKSIYFLSGRSMDPNTESYRKVIKQFILDYRVKRIFEIGCGDYRIMNSVLSHSAVSYIGSDVVKELIEDLSKIYGNEIRKFIHLDVVKWNSLPDADLCIVYQVFQHLSNNQVLKILKKTKKFKYVIITEHLAINPTVINMNKVTGNGVRMTKHQYSGVYLDSPPYSFECKTLLSCRSDYKDIPAIIKTVLIDNS